MRNDSENQAATTLRLDRLSLQPPWLLKKKKRKRKENFKKIKKKDKTRQQQQNHRRGSSYLYLHKNHPNLLQWSELPWVPNFNAQSGLPRPSY